MDAGGYFIINGSEKTVLAQERAAENKVYCFKLRKNNKIVMPKIKKNKINKMIQNCQNAINILTKFE